MPGSRVSFYFDGRIGRAPASPQLATEIERIITETRDAVVGLLDADSVHIAAQIIVSRDDLDELMSKIPAAAELFYGPFPAADDDGDRAVTVTLPDQDGIVRRHPY